MAKELDMRELRYSMPKTDEYIRRLPTMFNERRLGRALGRLCGEMLCHGSTDDEILASVRRCIEVEPEQQFVVITNVWNILGPYGTRAEADDVFAAAIGAVAVVELEWK